MSFFFLALPIIFYVIIWSWIIVGFLKKTSKKVNIQNNIFSISIIVPFRNEEKRMNPLLMCLQQLNDTNCELSILFIDDNSDDNGVQFLKTWIKKTSKKVKLLSLNKLNEKGKKRAIQKGVELSNSDWILTLDADSVVKKNFLQHLINEINQDNEFYLLPVIEKSNGFFLSVIESYMLSIITYASARNGHALLANGTGLLFKRELYLNVNPYKDNFNIPSGDDLFFLEKVLCVSTISPQALKNEEVVVFTESPKSYLKMIERAMRWSGKMSRVKLNMTKVVGTTVILSNISLLIMIFLLIFDDNYPTLLFILGLKFIFDVLLLNLGFYNYGGYKLVLITPFVFILYPIHLIIVAIALIYGKKKWKGRRI